MNLNKPPYLQVACDQITIADLEKVLMNIPVSPKIIIEAGTPLIKRFGIDIVKTIRKKFPETFVIADMKTLDVGELEVEICVQGTANAIALAGLANIETLNAGITASKKQKIVAYVDMMNVADPAKLLKNLAAPPDVVLFHRGIDAEGKQEHPWALIREVKKLGCLIAVAGGLDNKTTQKALANGADIVIIGRFLTADSHPQAKYQEILTMLH